MTTLYQFEFSHFCEKVRWALDYKGIPYTKRNLLPGLHVKVARKLAPKNCLPILVDGNSVVQDSKAILSYLDQKFPEPPLTPRDSMEAKDALAWEEYLDEEIGVPLRLWFYYYALPERNRCMRFLMDGAPWYGRPLFAIIYPKVRSAMTEQLHINASSAKQSEERLVTAFERLDGALEGRGFLVGSRFSRADLTACALLEHFCAPGSSDAEVAAAVPTQVCALRDQYKSRAFFGWVLENYKNYRQPMVRKAA
jgi:glutathione S-transferase